MNISTDWHWCWSSKSLKFGQHADSNSSPPLSLTRLNPHSISNYRTSIATKKTHTDEAPTVQGCLHKHKVLMCPSWVWTVKIWHSCHHGNFNCYYWTDSSSSRGIEVVEKLLSVSNWATWSNTSSPRGCSACGRSLAACGNTVRPSLVSDRRIRFVLGQLKK